MGSGSCGGGLARAGLGWARPDWLPTFDLNPLIGKNLTRVGDPQHIRVVGELALSCRIFCLTLKRSSSPQRNCTNPDEARLPDNRKTVFALQ
jgi:hypothetical protein